MIRTSHQLCVSTLKRNGRLLFGADEIPVEMPRMKGGYRIIALISGKTWQYGQLVHNSSFYNELIAGVRKSNFTISGLISIHPVALETIPNGDLIRHEE